MTDRRHVLIIDDSEDDREHYAEVLGEDTRTRWEIVESGDSVEGLALSAKHHFDCILLDYSLPGRSGLEVLQALRKIDVTVPIIMLTGQGSERIAVAAMKYGAQDYLLKSDVASPRLQQVINDAIEHRAHELDVLRRANYDHLTGVMSRALFMDHLKHALAISKRQCSPFALIYADIGISIGIAIHPTTAADIETLLEQADLSMYEAKRMSGTTWRIAEPRVRLKPDIT